MNRRGFLIGAAAAAGLARTGWTQGASQAGPADPAKLARIAVMTLNFQSILKLPDEPDEPTRTLELFDIPEMLADRYRVHNIEFQHYHIPSTELSYLKELRARIEKSRSRMTQINLEFGPLNMSAPELRSRLQAIDLTKRWIDHAATLGAQRVMINQGDPTHENKSYGIPTLQKMGDYGRSKGIIVSVETRGGGRRRRGGAGAESETPPPAPATPQEPAWVLVAEIIKESRTYANPDLGGIGAANQEELHACLRAMFPMSAGSLHARVSDQWDLATAIKFLEGLGYKGLYTIEVRGHEGTQEMYDIILATI